MTDFRTTDRDVNRAIRSWLREDRHEDVSRIAGVVLDQLDTTPQRRATAWPARRTPTMNKFITFGLGAAAVVVALFIGVQLFNSPGPTVGGPSEPTASPSPEPTVAPEPYAVVGDTFPGAGPLEPGIRYNASVDGSPLITFAVPAPGWRSHPPAWVYHGDGVSGPPGDALVWFGIESDAPAIYTDACAHTGMQEFEASAAGRVEAMAALDGAEVVSGPTPITIDGRSGQFVAIVIPEDVGCDNSEYYIGYNEDGSVSYYPAYLGGTILYWAVDLEDGQVYTLEVQTRPGLPADFLDEIERIVQSIQFE
jgi:hypothetical protein